jgi:dipeptidyl aminopeptidase/acylaminoacyl peptidase
MTLHTDAPSTLLAFTLACGFTAAPLTAAQPANSTQLIPREVFFGNPDRAAPNLSPDGKHLAFLAPLNGVMNVWIQPLADGQLGEARPITRSTDRPIRIFFWAENNEQIVYAQDRGGDENFRLYAVHIVTGNELTLTPFDNVQARVIAGDRQFPDEILAGINNRIPQLHDVWRINTRTGERELVYENNEGWAGFVPDHDYNLRLAVRFNQQGGTDLYLRHSADEPWQPFASWDMEDTMTSGPLGFARDGRTLYIRDSRNADTGGLYEIVFNEQGEASPPRLIARDDRTDVQGIVADPDTGRPQAVAFEYTRREWRILDQSIAADWDLLRTVSRGDFTIVSRTQADNPWTVAYVVDDGPVRYYLYDRAAKDATFLFTNRPALEGLPLARMEPVVIDSRDGLKLVSYLTRPTHSPSAANGVPQGPHPTVLLVHGGPWGRDTWGYNSLHQWLANRGYAVLSVNFRGSTGFGKDFVNAGNREWSGKMHDDLIDAVDWAISEGIADPDRVAIMGGSYGGYATLVGLTFTPEVFAAGVDIVGPSHVRTLLESIPPYWEPIKAMFETRVGSLDEPEYLDSISPLTHVDRIRRPLLIGQGANDPRVKEHESEQIVSAMQEKDIPVTYVVFPDEGHGFARPENSMAFWSVTEAFLAQHLGGRYEPIGEDLEKSTAKVPGGAELIPGLN